jgi:hypothetical protein
MAMIFGLAGLGLDTGDIAQAQNGCFGIGNAWKALKREVPVLAGFRQLFLGAFTLREQRDTALGQKLGGIGPQGGKGGKSTGGDGSKRG